MSEKLSKETQGKIQELQLLQQRLQLFTAQKQQFQMQMIEVENALEEIGKSKGAVYRLIGEILIEKNADEVKKDLADKKEELDLRIKTLDKQETKTKESVLALQKEISAELK